MISINAKLLHNYNLRAPGEDIVENPYTDEDYMPVQLLGLSQDEEVEESNYSTASASDVDDDEHTLSDESDSNEGDASDVDDDEHTLSDESDSNEGDDVDYD